MERLWPLIVVSDIFEIAAKMHARVSYGILLAILQFGTLYGQASQVTIDTCRSS